MEPLGSAQAPVLIGNIWDGAALGGSRGPDPLGSLGGDPTLGGSRAAVSAGDPRGGAHIGCSRVTASGLADWVGNRGAAEPWSQLRGSRPVRAPTGWCSLRSLCGRQTHHGTRGAAGTDGVGATGKPESEGTSGGVTGSKRADQQSAGAFAGSDPDGPFTGTGGARNPGRKPGWAGEQQASLLTAALMMMLEKQVTALRCKDSVGLARSPALRRHGRQEWCRLTREWSSHREAGGAEAMQDAGTRRILGTSGVQMVRCRWAGRRTWNAWESRTWEGVNFIPPSKWEGSGRGGLGAAGCKAASPSDGMVEQFSVAGGLSHAGCGS
ncbi:hypothetical protein Vafri_18521 [Volvox africanus]|uniref:Uncharacterized protein n=1 Tax=Volvox africanus TaxID=51714 RepID=A0A8J4F8H4_9CHLO|nr:hypothetical protein Vafri_18521 [Volvox africanus]